VVEKIHISAAQEEMDRRSGAVYNTGSVMGREYRRAGSGTLVTCDLQETKIAITVPCGKGLLEGLKGDSFGAGAKFEISLAVEKFRQLHKPMVRGEN
jgi:hypothetical protein